MNITFSKYMLQSFLYIKLFVKVEGTCRARENIKVIKMNIRFKQKLVFGNSQLLNFYMTPTIHIIKISPKFVLYHFSKIFKWEMVVPTCTEFMHVFFSLKTEYSALFSDTQKSTNLRRGFLP